MPGKAEPFYVYYVPKTHHDLGYTHTIDELLGVYSKYYDDVLDFCECTSDYPDEAKYRYTVESFWSLDYYIKHTSKENLARLKKYVSEGRIEIQAFYANVIDGICSEEEIARMIYPSAAFARECGVKLKSAALTDIPGLSSGVIKAMAKADIPYLFAGFPTYFSWNDYMGNPPCTPNSFWDENKLFGWGHPAAFNWEAIGGEKVFAWYQFGYGYMGTDHIAEIEADDYDVLKEKLPGYINKLKNSGMPYGVMRYVDHGLDNQQPDMSVSDVVRLWNEQHDDIKCVVATEAMFFEALKNDCLNKDVATVYGELTHTDYTTLSLSEAQITALNKNTKHKLHQLEKLNAILGAPLKNEEFSDIYKDIMLYDEHCYGMTHFGYENYYNRSFKTNYAYRAARITENIGKTLEEKATSKCDDNISVFSLSGLLGKCISTKLQTVPKSQKEMSSVYTSDNGDTVYMQVDTIEESDLPFYDLRKLYAMKHINSEIRQYTYAVSQSGNISSVTYKPTAKPEYIKKCSESNILENDYYRITVDENSGHVSVYDKELFRDISDGTFSMGEVVSRDIEKNVMYRQKTYSVNKRMTGPVADSIVVRSACYSMPSVVNEIILYHNVKRIDFNYRIVIDTVPMREAYIVFPAKIKQPQFSFQGIGSPVKAFDDIVCGANTNQYAAQNWCKAYGEDGEAVLAMDEGGIVEFGDINTTAVSQAHHHINPPDWEKLYVAKEDIKNSHMVSMILYNNCETNFPCIQQGEVIYRYSLTTGQRVNEEAFAENFVYPPIVVGGKANDFKLDLDNENLIVSAMKMSEDGKGIVLRIKEISGKKTTLSVSELFDGKKQAFVCNLIEQSAKRVDSGIVDIGPYETVVLKFE